jgi:hypothetical protein
MASISALTPCLDPAGDGMHVLINAAAPGALFGLAQSQAGRPPNVVKRAARMIRLLVDATAAQVIANRFHRVPSLSPDRRVSDVAVDSGAQPGNLTPRSHTPTQDT